MIARLLPLCVAILCLPLAAAPVTQEPAAPATSPPPPGAGSPVAGVPAVPAAYSSPRDTLTTFLDQMRALHDESDSPDDSPAWRKVEKAMDISGPGRAYARDMAWKLYAVYAEALGDPAPAQVAPDQQYVADNELGRFELFPDNIFAPGAFEPILDSAGRPEVAIVMERGEDGAWRFSEQTLSGVNELVIWAGPLGLEYGRGALRHVRSEAVRQWVPAGLQGRFFLGVELWQWIALAIGLFLVIAADLIARLVLARVLPRLITRYIATPDEQTVRDAVRPMALAIAAAIFLLWLALLGLALTPYTILNVAGRVVLVVGLAWAAWMLTDLIAGAFAARAEMTATKVDDMIVPLLRKTAKLFVVAMGVIYLAEAFDVEILPILASFGIAGLAISFAAQDMVKNLFGGLAVFLDQPFKIGERIKFKGYDGVVEEVGFRVTRLRLIYGGHLITLPNAGITTEPVENIDRRPFLQRNDNITITYDTPPEKIRQAVQIIRDILEEPGIREPIHPTIYGRPHPPRVQFNKLNADSLNIWVLYWYIPADWWAFMEHTQRVNLRLIEEFAQAGIEFAFPTQTLFLAGDPARQLSVNVMEAGAPREP